jgi:hypothetical protein
MPLFTKSVGLADGTSKLTGSAFSAFSGFQLPTIPDGKLVAVAEIDSASSLLLTG